jgi:hypothetical protein
MNSDANPETLTDGTLEEIAFVEAHVRENFRRLGRFLQKHLGATVATSTKDRLNTLATPGSDRGSDEDNVRCELWRFTQGLVCRTGAVRGDVESLEVTMSTYLRMLLHTHFPQVKYADVESELEWLCDWAHHKMQENRTGNVRQ